MNGLQDARRQRVARKAGQNIGVTTGFSANTNQSLAAAYAPIMFLENQNLINMPHYSLQAAPKPSHHLHYNQQ